MLVCSQQEDRVVSTPFGDEKFEQDHFPKSLTGLGYILVGLFTSVVAISSFYELLAAAIQ